METGWAAQEALLPLSEDVLQSPLAATVTLVGHGEHSEVDDDPLFLHSSSTSAQYKEKATMM